MMPENKTKLDSQLYVKSDGHTKKPRNKTEPGFAETKLKFDKKRKVENSENFSPSKFLFNARAAVAKDKYTSHPTINQIKYVLGVREQDVCEAS